MASKIWRAIRGASPSDGSSRISRRGRLISARPIASTAAHRRIARRRAVGCPHFMFSYSASRAGSRQVGGATGIDPELLSISPRAGLVPSRQTICSSCRFRHARCSATMRGSVPPALWRGAALRCHSVSAPIGAVPLVREQILGIDPADVVSSARGGHALGVAGEHAIAGIAHLAPLQAVPILYGPSSCGRY